VAPKVILGRSGPGLLLLRREWSVRSP
jgi:hypothetical protein